MNTNYLQRILFVTCSSAAILCLIFEELHFLKYILFAGSAIYLFFGWSMELIRERKAYLAHEFVGYTYSTVFFAYFFNYIYKVFSQYLIWYGFILALSLVVYMLFKRRTVKTDMLIQSIVLLILAPLPALF
jgi:hypothetical protein